MSECPEFLLKWCVHWYRGRCVNCPFHNKGLGCETSLTKKVENEIKRLFEMDWLEKEK